MTLPRDMDRARKGWYPSCMTTAASIPVFALFGETGAFPDIVHCEAIRARAPAHGWRITPHRHREIAQIFQLDAGAATVIVDGREAALQPGDLLYVPARIVHALQFVPGSDGLVLSIPMPVLAGLGPANGALGQRLGQPVRTRATPGLRALLGQVADGFAAGGQFRAHRLAALAQAVLAAVAEAGVEADPEAGGERSGTLSGARRRLADYDALIAARMGAGWRVADYAAALSITPGHLTRICRAAAGTSAQGYHEAAVMAEACRLLAFTRMTVAEIGDRLGYPDPAHFSRRFRARRGETPTGYRAGFHP